jgi:hypothetical protein
MDKEIFNMALPHTFTRFWIFIDFAHRSFEGPTTLIVADDWLCEIEMKLDVVHANDRDRVLLTVQQLVGPALAW